MTVSGSVFRAIMTRDMNRSATARWNFARMPIHADNENNEIMIMKLMSKIRTHQEDTRTKFDISVRLHTSRQGDAKFFYAKIKFLHLIY